MADLVHQRGAKAIGRRARQLDRGPLVEYLAFLLAGDVYAAPVTRIREILKSPPMTPVPRAPRSILGIISVRGQLVTVIDLRQRLGLVEAGSSPRSRILLVEGAGGEMLGLYVDEVLQVYRLSESEIESVGPALGGDVSAHITGIARPAESGLADGSTPGAAQASTKRSRRGAPPLAERHSDDDPSARRPAEGAPSPLARPDAPVIILLDLRALIGG